VDLFAHSLGARVALGAVPLLHAGALGRVFLLAGAELGPRALRALDTPAGRTAEFFNITTRENDIFDLLFELSQIPLHGRALDRPGAQRRAELAGLQIDHRQRAGAPGRLGFDLAPPRLRVCHWSVYLRPGIFRLYRALVHERARLALPVLREALNEPRSRAGRGSSRAPGLVFSPSGTKSAPVNTGRD
jgi:hypothetical protein